MATTKQATELAETLMRLHRQVRSALGAVAYDFDLTVQQAELLCVVQHREPSFGELAERLGCDKTNVTGMVDRLVRRGLVERYPDQSDRRVSRLRLTKDGEATGRRVKQRMAATVQERWGTLRPADRAALDRLTSSDLSG